MFFMFFFFFLGKEVLRVQSETQQHLRQVDAEQREERFSTEYNNGIPET